MRHAANEGDVDGVKVSKMLRKHPKDTALLRAEAALYESEAFAAANDAKVRETPSFARKTPARPKPQRY